MPRLHLSHQRLSALICVLTFSVLLRVAVAFYYGDIVDAPPLLTDQRSYHWLAVRLLQGEGFSFPRAWYPFTPAESPTAHWSFLYSLIATLFPAAIVGTAHAHHGPAPVYFEAAAVITALVLLGQVLELRARSQTGGAIRA